MRMRTGGAANPTPDMMTTEGSGAVGGIWSASHGTARARIGGMGEMTIAAGPAGTTAGTGMGAGPPPLAPPPPPSLPAVAPELDGEVTADEIRMMAAMGIPFGFDTTQGKQSDDPRTSVGAVKVKSTRQARQFMNRRGGFNRPLPAERTGQKVAGD